MILKDLSLISGLDNVLLDEAMFLLADKHNGGELLRFWESPTVFIVLGRIGNLDEDVDLVAAQKDRVEIVRRTSGGGTVVQGPGCLNYTLILSKDRDPALADLRQSYLWISQKIISALKTLGIDALFRPISDMALAGNEKKFSGNAQRRGKNVILHHGTILYDFDLNLISRYLKMPKDVPEYRRGRAHAEFVTNIAIDPQRFKETLSQILVISTIQKDLSLPEKEMLNALQEKFSIPIHSYPQSIQ